MSAHAAGGFLTRTETASQPGLARAKQILKDEVTALNRLAEGLDATFVKAVERLENCGGCVVVTGIGKAGIVGQKISASLSSTGTPSYFLHPSEAVHGDLGCIRSNDVVLILSYSGETDEVTRLLPCFKETAAATVAITSDNHNTLARSVDVSLSIGRHREACALGLAPTSTTTLMMALGDALALVVSERKGFTKSQFAKFHPAGSLGRQLMNVKEVMRPLVQCRVASENKTVRQVFVQVSRPGRRTGAIMLTDTSGRLTGIFTDSDLARLLEQSGNEPLDQPVASVMSRRFQTIDDGSRLPAALRILSEFKISELPVIDGLGNPVGMIDITDVLEDFSTLPLHLDQPPRKPSTDPSDGPRILSMRARLDQDDGIKAAEQS